MFSAKKRESILNKTFIGIRVKYLLSILLFFIPFSKKAINRNKLYTEITYYNIFGLETFKIEKWKYQIPMILIFRLINIIRLCFKELYYSVIFKYWYLNILEIIYP